VGGLLLLLAVLCLLGLRGHAGMALAARVLGIEVTGFIGMQVFLGQRLPGFHWRTRS
jgi:hypothetical protein